ncbi:hypothetical protein SARC_08701 [Sphaeroforma arctica JP610]|uniref:Uncharacterized protein n=1 Tax=Sphaeroforma arctica JP610 TaxID=667725 RepID=A0A0L0FPZ6_9EUKA|nr:hypothetical protein SARC_08701 [Sphaeroforma arctica JP610]KNC78885.1 hypothetical protein SARC_08701 [Sphaeroforma arctica JP610]|eukprot:XP_014152787.1 hypothetical protein SARC_08701 [Sphaeroforma arctica JP610]
MSTRYFEYNYEADLDRFTQVAGDKMFNYRVRNINPKYDQVQYDGEDTVLNTSAYKCERVLRTNRSRDKDSMGPPSVCRLSPHGFTYRSASKEKGLQNRKRSINLVEEPTGNTQTSDNYDLASHHMAWFDHEEVIAIILRHGRNSKTDELLCPLNILREVQINLVVSIALHELPSKKLFDSCLRSPEKAACAIRSFTEGSRLGCVSKLSKLYVGWWNTAYNCTGTDVVRAIVADLLENPMAVNHQQHVLNDALSDVSVSKVRISKINVKSAVHRTSSMVHSVAKASKKAVRACRQRSHPGTRQNTQRRASIRLAQSGRRATDFGRQIQSRSSCPALMQDIDLYNNQQNIYPVNTENSSEGSGTGYAFSETITDGERDYFDWLEIDRR